MKVRVQFTWFVEFCGFWFSFLFVDFCFLYFHKDGGFGVFCLFFYLNKGDLTLE